MAGLPPHCCPRPLSQRPQQRLWESGPLVLSVGLSQHLTKCDFENSGHFSWAVAVPCKGHDGEEAIRAFPVSLDSL